MKSLISGSILVLILAAGLPAAPTTAPAEPNHTAVIYGEAIELMRGLSDADGERLGLCGKDGCWVVNTPLDAAAADLVKRQAKAIELARKAAAMPPARWATDDDVQKTLDRINRGPRLSALLVLNARHEFRAGRTQRGLDDVLAAIALSRHFASDATFMSKLIEISAWRPAADLLARQLPTLPRDVVATLPARLEKLPPSPTMKQSILAEKAWAKRTTKDKGFAMVVMVSGLNDFFDALAAGGHLAPDEFAKLVDREAAKYPLNTLAQVMAPSVRNTRKSLAVFEAKQAMLDAAIRVVADGDDAITKSTDPFGDGRPFLIRKGPSGFELEGVLRHEGEPVKLLVGDPAPLRS